MGQCCGLERRVQLSEVQAEIDATQDEADALLEKKKSQEASPKRESKEEKRPSVVTNSLVSDGKAKELAKDS